MIKKDKLVLQTVKNPPRMLNMRLCAVLLIVVIIIFLFSHQFKQWQEKE